jgi:hypothetical protein
MQRTETVLTAHAEPHSLILEAIISRITTRTAEYNGDSFLEESGTKRVPNLLKVDAPNQIDTNNHLSFELVLRYQTSLSRQLALALVGLTQVRQQMSSTLLLRRRRRHS